ncbi:chemotaxis protein CheA (plasmid) [Neorhizobium sp. SOG26]|uniref:chemotaxis protein CheA n=1 Tax=Neorhizobium sp. SOG26 TaxID=2060726 RepID=UPI000E584D82|nr:chemotaxis protein CheA [Neorhizobium sp. SOG26]AXV17492.1 chemotaxis protein CheA [Neorhizobium sp. SOG26]
MSTPDPVQVFRVEAGELLEQIENGLLDLLNDLDDKNLINAVFRGLHTLKGSGAMFGFDALAAFTHHCETAFDRVRKGEVPATNALVSAVLDARDHMRALVDDPSGKDDVTGERLLAQLNAAVDGAGGNQPDGAALSLAQSQATPPAKPRGPVETTFKLTFRLPANAMVNGTNPVGLLNELRELGPAVIAADLSLVPPLDQIEADQLYIGWTVELTTRQTRQAIDDVFIFVLDEMELEVTEVARTVVAETAADAVEAAEVVTSATTAGAAPAVKPNPKHQPDEAEATPVEKVSRIHDTKPSENVRVPAERLDELMDRVGELVIAQSRLSQLASSSADIPLRSVSEDIERLSNELRDTMMMLRMVPITQLFGRFRRLIHDLSRETGKVIDLVTEGETTEVDKTVIERLADPLVHLVRNSVDHGLERPEDRRALGKPEAGRITLSAQQAGGEVIIMIRDDGRGIDRQRVRAKGESSGLIHPGEALSDQELLQLIFQPGFSTAAKITNLSGRGVGMDVVKKSVEALRGSIDVQSEDGKGSTIALRIPLTLAIIDGLLVRVGSGRYVIPLSSVEECLELSLDEDLRSRGRSFISLRDSLVPFIRLREIFDTGTQPELHQKVVVVSTGAERVGLVVDQIIGDHQTVIKSMSPLHHDIDSFSGATILGDGNLALILDVVHLVTLGQQEEARLRAAV